MRLLVFFVVAMAGLVVAYGFGLGGAVAALVFLFILFTGVLDRWAQPLFQRLRP